MRVVISLIAVVLLAGGCAERKGTQSLSCFDARTFFETVARDLSLSRVGLRKEIMFGGKKSVVQSDAANWHAELKTFLETDLRKPLYSNAFWADTLKGGGNSYCLVYTSKEEGMDLRKVEVCFGEQDKVKIVKFSFSESNLIYSSAKELEFYADSAFRVAGWQKLLLRDEVRYTVRGTFIKASS